MGSLWLARHEGLGTEVVVKFIRAELASANTVQRLEREARAAARIGSPHIVTVHDSGVTADGQPYIIMERLHGESLEDRLERVRRLSRDDAMTVVKQTAQVLERAHALGIVHRDIKPDNLFLVDTGFDLFVKVLDFGIAKSVEPFQDVSVTATGAMLGSPLYMSPEQFTEPKAVDGRADLWSLSVVAYHLLTGRPSFGGETLGQVMMSVMNRTYSDASTVNRELSAPIDAFFHRAFAEHIEERFQTARELATAFAEACRATNLAATAILPSGTVPGQPVPEALVARPSHPSSLPGATPSTLASAGGSSTGVGTMQSVPGAAPGTTGVAPPQIGIREARTLEGAASTLSPERSGRRTGVWILGLVAAALASGGLVYALTGGDGEVEPSSATPAMADPATAEPATGDAPEPEPEPVVEPSATASTSSEPAPSATANAPGPPVEPPRPSTVSHPPPAPPVAPVPQKKKKKKRTDVFGF